ncbi:enhancer of polycomb-like protein 1 [Impatiens glandulifera]|uniref:enhancer of polycomb-like protein 1 n=1 Tax=Impatiens glandulifera TaxID=253017 RepID=UPI001FB08D44|nr:enhancer of polycomb-like protein 1 [Impatiens glandulifera]XP_047307273.1 enhancer of polycomb-like protein 1 [Impatiens glandulifera]XP_047307274.1 enhancer of polycomb-like protein 1 [Impatiens glandulifera]
MSRLSIRPRPLDIHKKLPIVKSIKDLEDDDTPTSTRNSHLLHLVVQAEVEHVSSSKKLASEIPIPQFVIVDTYERDYACTFSQPASYLRARGARSEIGEFVEYDLDNEDEDWLEHTIKEKKHISSEKFELILFKLEVLDHKAREKAGLMAPILGSPVPVLLQFETVFEALQAIPNLSVKYGVLQSIYSYWKEKREQWQKPVLRRLQPPPPVNDTNPFNVFRRREKVHKHHTRRMQRREDGVHSFEKLRQVRRNLEQAKMLLDSLIKREEKKREVMESEVNLQRIQLKYKNETELLEDAFALAFPSVPSFQGNYGSSEEEFVDSDDDANSSIHVRHASDMPVTDSNPFVVSTGRMNRDLKPGWLDPLEPVFMFIKPLDPEMLAAAGVVPPPSDDSSGSFHGRIGRGGRIIYDRWNPLLQTPIVDPGNHPLHMLPSKPSPSPFC